MVPGQLLIVLLHLFSFISFAPPNVYDFLRYIPTANYQYAFRNPLAMQPIVTEWFELTNPPHPKLLLT